jgi:hypothetical protein
MDRTRKVTVMQNMKVCCRKSAGRIAAITIVAVAVSISAVSQLQPCSHSIPAPPYKVFVDGVNLPASGADATKNLKKRIGAAVENNIAEIKMQLLDTQLKQQKTLQEIRVITCDDARFPSGIAEFSDREMRTLADSRVLLEIWGDVLSADEGTAYMGYALAPAFKVKLPAVYSIRENLGQTSTSAEQLFKENKALKAYAEVAVGIQFFRNDDFDAAVGYLCGGALKLERALAARPAAHTPDEQLFVREQRQLIDGVRALGGQAIQKASERPDSAVKAVAGTANVCPAGGN